MGDTIFKGPTLCLPHPHLPTTNVTASDVSVIPFWKLLSHMTGFSFEYPTLNVEATGSQFNSNQTKKGAQYF